MKTVVVVGLLVLLMSGTWLYSDTEEEKARVRKGGGPKYIEIDCMMTGGMERVLFNRHLFTFRRTLRKWRPEGDVRPTSGSLDSFVMIERTTRLDSDQIEKLRDWIARQRFPDLERVDDDGKERRYGGSLMVYADGKEHVVNHPTIAANEKLRKEIGKLFELAKTFTRVAGE